MKAMVIDIGSNTVKYDVFEIQKSALVNVGHKSEVLGFISYIDKDGIPSSQGMERLCAILSQYCLQAQDMECSHVLAFATASLRRCAYPEIVIGKIYEKTGLRVELFSGETEARMSLEGVLVTHPEANDGVMADMGGGSTELNLYKSRRSVYLVSNPFGALSLKNEFVKSKGTELGDYANAEELEAIYRHAEKVTSSLPIKKCDCGDFMFIVGGSARAIGALAEYHLGKSGELGVEDLVAVAREYKCMDRKLAQRLEQLTPQREKLIIPALTAFIAICHVLGIKRIRVALGGIREGYAHSTLIGKEI